MEQTQMKQARKDITALGLCYLFGTIGIYLAKYAMSWLIVTFKPEWLKNPDLAIILGMIPIYLVGMPILMIMVKRLPVTVPEKRHMKAGSFVLSFMMCYSISIICNVIGLIITFLIGLFKGGVVQNNIANLTADASLGVMFVCMVIWAPIMEEYLFRKLIVDRTVRYGQGVAVLVSGLMFGLFHGNLNQFVYAFPMGMFMAFLYVKTGKLKITIGIHMIINFLGSIVVTLLTDAIGLEEYTALMYGGVHEDILMAFIMEHLLGWILYMGYIVLIFGTVIAGFVLLIVFHKKFRLSPGEVEIPKGKKFTTVFLNLGMGLFCLFWIAVIVLQLFS